VCAGHARGGYGVECTNDECTWQQVRVEESGPFFARSIGDFTVALRERIARIDDDFSFERSVASRPDLLASGVGMHVLARSVAPKRVVRGLPHKLAGLRIDAITEQRPDPDSRITLSHKTDSLGVPIARVDWRIDDDVRRSLMRLGQLLAEEFLRAGMPTPQLEDWIKEQRPKDSVITDHGHTCGTTRMSDDPRLGVVDANCQVHGVARLYVAGASVFPTSGHANPTLMIVSLAIRLADRIKLDLTRC
jgi:choline dehydrogenase-like flavoprotein